MYQIQSDKLNYFEQQINNPLRKITYKFTLNDEELLVSDIMDNPTLVTDTGLEQYGVGCALTTQLQMSVKSELLIIPKDKITVEIGLDIYNEATQEWETIYTPIGTFYVDTIEEKGIKKSIKAYDGMYKLNKGYFPSAKHTNTQAIANDIATANGYKLKGISNVNINNEQLEGKTCVEMLSIVASAIGGHVRISRDGSSIEFIEPTNYGLLFDESDYTTPTIDNTTTYNITKLHVNYSDKVTNDEGIVTDEGYYEVGKGTNPNTLELSNPLLKGQHSQATNVLNKIKQLNGYKRFDTSMPLADFRLEPMDMVAYTKGEVEYIVPILYMKMVLSYQGISIETQSPTVAESKSEFSFKGTLSQKVENIYTDIIQVKQLTANKVTTDELEATVATIKKLYATKAEIGELVAGSIVVEELKAQIAEIDKAIINKADINDLNALNATINSLKAKVAEIDTLIANSILSEIIQSGSISSDLLNVKDGFIKDAMINSLSASKINSGIINTNNVSVQSENGDMLLQGNLLQFKDKNGKIRIQIGQDTTGNYTFTLYDSTGKGVLINQDGIQSSSAIKDGLIVDANINDNANISGSKLDIASLYEHMNEDGSNTLKASKIYFDDKAQTLDVSFKEMTTKQDELEDTMSTAITDISVSKGQISQLIQNTTITTSEGTTTLKDAYNHTKNTVDGHSTTIGNMESTLNAQTGEIQNVKNEVANFDISLEKIELGLSTLDKKVQDDYYNKTQTDSQIETKANQISLSVAKNEVSNLQIGGANLLLNSDERKQLDRADGVPFNEIGYALVETYSDLVLTEDMTFSLSFLVDRVGNTEFECFDTITFDVGWNYRWTRADIEQIIHIKDNTYKFVMKPKILQAGTIISNKLTFIAEYYYGGGIFYNVMLVEGQKAFTWSPANQDVKSSIAKIDIKTDSITSSVTKIENSMAIDNLLANGNFTNELNNWQYSDYGSPVNYSLSANTDWTMVGKTALLLTQSWHPQGVDSGFTQIIEVKPNTNYTFTGYIASHRAEGMVIIKDEAGNWLHFDKTDADYDQYTGGADISRWKRVRLVYYSGNRNKLQLHLAMAKSNENGHVWFHDFMVTEGDTDLCWKPSERETRTQIAQLSDRITSTVSSIQTVEGKVNQAQSQIDQQATQIAHKVNTNDFSTLVQQNGHNIMFAINNSRNSMGIGIDMNGLYGYNNNIATFRLTEGKMHVYNSITGAHMGYFGTLGDDLRASLYGTNTFSIYSADSALLLRARYQRDASYGNATLDMCGGINFIHKPGVSVGINQILLGNDDRSDAYGYHNMSIRCHNSLGFQDNWGLTHMFADTRRGRWIMKGAVYQNTQTPPATFSMNFDGEDEIYNSGYARSQAIDSIMNLKTGVYVDNDGECCSAIYGGFSELITTEYSDEDGNMTTHLNHEALNASLVVTCQEQQKLINALQQELNEIKEYLKIA